MRCSGCCITRGRRGCGFRPPASGAAVLQARRLGACDAEDFRRCPGLPGPSKASVSPAALDDQLDPAQASQGPPSRWISPFPAPPQQFGPGLQLRSQGALISSGSLALRQPLKMPWIACA
jgi:hypothetical protein